MATRAKPAPAAEVVDTDDIDLDSIDFDAWTKDDEQKAIEALAPKIKYVIVEKSFIGRFEDGAKVKLPLNISLDELDSLSEEAADPVDQVKLMLERLGGPESRDEFTRHSLPETIAMAQKFSEVFQRIAGAKLPES